MSRGEGRVVKTDCFGTKSVHSARTFILLVHLVDDLEAAVTGSKPCPPTEPNHPTSSRGEALQRDALSPLRTSGKKQTKEKKPASLQQEESVAVKLYSPEAIHFRRMQI